MNFFGFSYSNIKLSDFFLCFSIDFRGFYIHTLSFPTFLSFYSFFDLNKVGKARITFSHLDVSNNQS
jgi:hypothetical protein